VTRVLIAVAAALSALVLVGCSAAGDEGKPLLRAGRSINATTELTPRSLLFGDTLKARLAVAVDRRRIDPETVDVRTSFKPFEVIGDVDKRRRDVGNHTELTYTYTLRCDEFLCLPRGGRIPFRFAPARVGPLRVNWPSIEVATRINESELNAFRYRALLTPLQEPTYRIAPTALATTAFLGAGLLLLVGAFFGLRIGRGAWARRSPELNLPPVERALVLLRWTRDGEDRRRALELLAEALDEEQSPELARAARKLAWSDEPPSAELAEELARRIEEARRAAA
jgi:hypothetical protein